MDHRQFFHLHISPRLQRALTKAVLENCKEASRFCYRNFAPPQAKDLSGDYRRAKIEDEFAGIKALFKEVDVSIEQYEHKTGNYNELTVGAVKLTQSCIADQNDIPRMAKFRSTLADKTQRSFVFTDEGDDSEEDASFLYTILTYGIDVNSPKRSWPAFIKFQFPNRELTRYVCEGIDMFKRFPDLVAEYVPRPTLERQLNRRQRRRAAGE